VWLSKKNLAMSFFVQLFSLLFSREKKNLYLCLEFSTYMPLEQKVAGIYFLYFQWPLMDCQVELWQWQISVPGTINVIQRRSFPKWQSPEVAFAH